MPKATCTVLSALEPWRRALRRGLNAVAYYGLHKYHPRVSNELQQQRPLSDTEVMLEGVYPFKNEEQIKQVRKDKPVIQSADQRIST